MLLRQVSVAFTIQGSHEDEVPPALRLAGRQAHNMSTVRFMLHLCAHLILHYTRQAHPKPRRDEDI